MTNPQLRNVSTTQVISFEGNLIRIMEEGRLVAQYNNIEKLSIFNGSHITEYPEYLEPAEGQLYVAGNKAFFSTNGQLNTLVNNQIKTIAPTLVTITIQFTTLGTGERVLLVNGTRVVTLSGAVIRDVRENQFIQYANDTIHIRNSSASSFAEMFPGVTRFSIIRGIQPELVTYRGVIAGEVPGGGQLYIQGLNAFYSRDSRINIAISNYLSTVAPPTIVVVSTSFNQTLGGTRVRLLVNGDELITLSGAEIQRVSSGQRLVYRNNTIIVFNAGKFVIKVLRGVDQFQVFDGSSIQTYKGSALNEIIGEGNLYASGNRAFFSTNIPLNNQIDEALLDSTPGTSPSRPSPTPTTSSPSPPLPSGNTLKPKKRPDQEVRDNSPSARSGKKKPGRHNQAVPGSNSSTLRRPSKEPHSSPIPRPPPSNEKSKAHQRRPRPNAPPRSDTKSHRRPSPSHRRPKPSPGPQSSPLPNSQQHSRPSPSPLVSDSSVKHRKRPRRPGPAASAARQHDTSRQESSSEQGRRHRSRG